MKRRKTTRGARPILSGTKTRAGRKVDQTLALLASIGVPIAGMTPLRKDRIALALLSIANMKPDTDWASAAVHDDGSGWKLTSKEIIKFQNTFWNQSISSGSYDDIRRVDLEPLLLAGIAIPSAGNPNAADNNPTRGYAVHPSAGKVFRAHGTPQEATSASAFLVEMGSLLERMERRRPPKIEVTMPDGKLIALTSGTHNALQKAVIEQFIPRFAPVSKVLYVGDASNKYLHVEAGRMQELGLNPAAHDMLPDVVVEDERNGWLLLIEAVHSSNPISQLRHLALEKLTSGCVLPKVFISVFASRAELRRWICEISWETEVWLTDAPDHLIHFNGDRYLGPHSPP